jgi:hypothetical protein
MQIYADFLSVVISPICVIPIAIGSVLFFIPDVSFNVIGIPQDNPHHLITNIQYHAIPNQPEINV